MRFINEEPRSQQDEFVIMIKSTRTAGDNDDNEDDNDDKGVLKARFFVPVVIATAMATAFKIERTDTDTRLVNKKAATD